MAENKPCCPEKVELLIQADKGFTEADRDWLLSMNEEQFGKVLAISNKPAPEAPQINADQAMAIVKESLKTHADFIKLLPESMREKVEAGMALYDAHRETLIKTITDNSDAFSKDELATESTGKLEKLAKMAKKSDYSGQGAGSPPQVNANGAGEPLLPNMV